MAISEVSFEEARAKQWMTDVNNELEDTRSLLQEIGPVLEKFDGEDPLLNTMKETGKLLENNFMDLCEGFNMCIQMVDCGLNKIAEGVVDVYNMLLDLLNKIRG